MHDCDGHLQVILSDTASAEQRAAILAILSSDNQPKESIFSIFNCIAEHRHEPLVRPIDIEWDIANSAARIAAPGVIEARSVSLGGAAPASGDSSIGQGSATSSTNIAFEMSHCHAALSYFEFDNDRLRFSKTAF